ncbi:hypothetical protein ACVWXS_001225 [Lysinibacillus sp. TE18511]|jgi:hypothetical protein
MKAGRSQSERKLTTRYGDELIICKTSSAYVGETADFFILSYGILMEFLKFLICLEFV